MLEAETDLRDDNLGQGLEDARLISVDVVFHAQLRAVVVSPREHSVQAIQNVDKATAHL